jgi:glycosyltransferase involved in cell wall biosynthesis
MVGLMGNKMPIVALAANNAWNIYNFRKNLIGALQRDGYQVLAITPDGPYRDKLLELGCLHSVVQIDSKGTNPLRDAKSIVQFIQILKRHRPHVFLGFTIKANIYGAIAARLLNISVINSIEGLGAAFITNNWLNKFVGRLYSLAFIKASRVIFLNEDDMALFNDRSLVDKKRAIRIPGLGVDLKEFRATAIPKDSLRFLFVGRMLQEKGVCVYVEAARILKTRYPDVQFDLLGFLDVDSPSAISSEQMYMWQNEGVVRYLGVSDKVADIIADVSCVVLPSYYREGVPRSLMEAAAMGRPIITTDWVGCRDVVVDGSTGYLCRINDAYDLATKMEQFIHLPYEARAVMGLAGRVKMEQEFDEKNVILLYLDLIREAMLNGAH